MNAPSRQERYDVAGPVDVVVELDAGRVDVRLGTAGTAAPGAADTTGPTDPPGGSGGSGGSGATGSTDATHTTDAGAGADASDTSGISAAGGAGPTPGVGPGGTADVGSRELWVEVTADPEGAPGWIRGLAGLAEVAGGLERRFGVDLGALTGLGTRPGEDAEARARRAVDAVEISLADGRLTVRGPREVVLRTVPLAVTVHGPAGSGVAVRAGAAPVDVIGRPGEVEVRTTGGVTLDEVAARSSVRCGAGDVSVRRVAGVLRVKGGAGDVVLDDVAAPVEVVTGSGSVTADRVRADLTVRCGSGDVSVRDAAAGDLDLTTGAGSVRIGVHPGVDASVDLRSAVGSASSDLPVSRTAPDDTGEISGARPLRIRGRAAAGSARVQSAPQ